MTTSTRYIYTIHLHDTSTRYSLHDTFKRYSLHNTFTRYILHDTFYTIHSHCGFKPQYIHSSFYLQYGRINYLLKPILCSFHFFSLFVFDTLTISIVCMSYIHLIYSHLQQNDFLNY